MNYDKSINDSSSSSLVYCSDWVDSVSLIMNVSDTLLPLSSTPVTLIEYSPTAVVSVGVIVKSTYEPVVS